jgi:hypothetical protein
VVVDAEFFVNATTLTTATIPSKTKEPTKTVRGIVRQRRL